VIIGLLADLVLVHIHIINLWNHIHNHLTVRWECEKVQIVGQTA
jgi:hypothetical protein